MRKEPKTPTEPKTQLETGICSVCRLTGHRGSEAHREVHKCTVFLCTRRGAQFLK